MKNLLLTGLLFAGIYSYGQAIKTEHKMKKTALEVFQAFGQGLMSGTDVWKNHIADDIKFIGPVDQVNGREEFIKLNESFMPVMKGNEILQIVEKDNWVITQIEMKILPPSGKEIILEMTEWYEINDDKIQSIKVYYDAEEFRKEMSLEH